MKWIFLVCLFSFRSFSADYDLTNKLNARNEMALGLMKIRPYLYDDQVQDRLESWLNHPQNLEYSVECQYKLRPFFPVSKILSNVCYFLRNEDSNKRTEALKFVSYSISSNWLALLEITDDPHYQASEKQKAQNILNVFKQHDPQKISQCFTPAFKVDWKKAIDTTTGKMTYSPFTQVISCLRALPGYSARLFINNQWATVKMPYTSLNLASEFSNHPGHVVSQTGWIPGNNITYLNVTPATTELFNILKPKAHLVAELYPLDSKGSFDAFYAKGENDVFTVAEGFYTPESDPVWNSGYGILNEIKKAVLKAEDTIFIDIFFLGGQMGVTMAKTLIKQLEQRPNLKIFILRDNINHLTYEKDMKPVFNYLLAYSLKHPSRLIISPSHINSHKSGLPSYLSSSVNDSWLELAGINTSMRESRSPIHLGIKSDHSKVLVIDAKGQNPIAFVGSKNWVNSSGAICYDDVGMISGPAALVVQDDYYYDMFYALRYEIKEKVVDLWAKDGWAKEFYNASQPITQKIINVLKPFDLLNRNERGEADTSQKVITPMKGNALLRTGMNNVDSTVMSALDQNIQAILFAKNRIYINDQYVFDRNIINALLIAKKRNPALEIKLILEPILASPIPGMPNLLYADVLTKAGIQIKFKKKTTGDSDIEQEYHMKTISTDGQFVIVGSANKDFNTMFGSFREEQLDVFDQAATMVHDKLFIERWNNPKETNEVFTQFSFTVPPQIKGLDGRDLTCEQFVSLLRSAISVMFDFVNH